MNKLLLTIDTEGPRGEDPILYQIWGKVGEGEFFGIPRIIDILDEYHIKGLFFVDIPEIWDYGYDKVRDVVNYIRERGHDVGMHIHPHHMPGESRQFLFEYTKEEQFEIIKKCTDSYIQICGEPPQSFRAGKYGANRYTLDIIAELGYRYDFSEFYSNKWCGIKPEIAYVYPQRYKSIIEFPVTVFCSCNLFGYKRYDKLEVTDNYREALQIVNQYSQSLNDGVIILFMHSFSLINYLDTPNNPTINKTNQNNFVHLLEGLSRLSGIEYIREKDLQSIVISGPDTIENIVTTKGYHRQVSYTLRRAYEIRKYNHKAKLFFGFIWIICALMVLILFGVIIW